jgi:hypothetical protein
MMAATALATSSSADGDLKLCLGQEVHGVFAAAVDLGVAFLTAEPLTSVTVMPSMPTAPSASLTSSNLNGLMIAMMSFMVGKC